MKTNTLLLLAGAGAAAWYFYGRQAAASPALDKSTGTPSRPFGDPADPGSVANACNAAFRVTRLGHPMQAAPWLQICQAGGGTVPQTADQQYT